MEAARAGDAGRGFALVSGDIRSLAQEASASADQVKDTVRNIIDQIASVRRNLEHVTESAATEVEKNRLLFTALDKVGKRYRRAGRCQPIHRPPRRRH